jgi:glycogen(starch) synthase
MRVLMTTDTVGGVWTYSRELTEGLLRRGSSVTLMSMGRMPSREQAGWVERVKAGWGDCFEYVPTAFKLEWMQDGADCYERSAEIVVACARACGAEVLHSNQFCYGALDVAIPKLVVAHSDVWSWWAACRGGAPEASVWSAAYRGMVIRGLRGADVVIAPSAWMEGQLEECYGFSGWSRVIANGRSHVEAENGVRRMQAITCGRLWDEAKNVRLLREVDAGMPILVAGEAVFEAEGGFEMLGPVEMLGSLTEAELQVRFQESAIYLLTSRYEPFGLAPVEAALAGCAIVAHDIPSLHEVWGDAALYFDRDSAASLSAVLRGLARDPERVRTMAEAAGRRARERYSAERMTEAYLAMYGELLRDCRHVA